MQSLLFGPKEDTHQKKSTEKSAALSEKVCGMCPSVGWSFGLHKVIQPFESPCDDTSTQIEWKTESSRLIAKDSWHLKAAEKAKIKDWRF